jgi:hypothetical protein
MGQECDPPLQAGLPIGLSPLGESVYWGSLQRGDSRLFVPRRNLLSSVKIFCAADRQRLASGIGGDPS